MQHLYTILNYQKKRKQQQQETNAIHTQSNKLESEIKIRRA